MAKKKQITKREKRNLRLQQVAFFVVSALILLAMILSMLR